MKKHKLLQTRFNFNLPDEIYNMLLEQSGLEGASLTEVVKSSIRLYHFVRQHQRAGDRILIEEYSEQGCSIQKELIFL